MSELFGLRVSPQIARAQVEGLQQRIPFLYAILSTNVAALAYTHHKANPFWLCVLIPAVSIAFMMVRAVAWAKVRPNRMTDQQIHRLRRSITFFGTMFGLVILVWAIELTRSPILPGRPGLMTDTGHAVFFVGITMVSSIFLLMHHRFASLMVGVCVVVPFAGYLLSLNQVIETAVALNVVLVAAAMLLVAVSYSRQFDQSVVAAADLLRLSAENAQQAAADTLTSLPNRREFFRRLDAAATGTQPFAVIVCDLDGFKQINDVYGHQAGDEVLRQIARRLREAVPEPFCLARLGGDEFACLIETKSGPAVLGIAEAMIERCREPIVCGSFTARVGASAGICSSSSVGSAVNEVYECADFALFDAKRSGRNRVETFSAEHQQSMRRDSRIAHLLRCADLKHEMQPHFQPIVDAATYELRSFEALVRWTNPELGCVGPDEFIPIAERTNLIFQISLLVLRSALAQAEKWPALVTVKVNLSVCDLMSKHQTEALLAEVSRSRVAAGRVTLEITETILAESLDKIRANVDILRAAGCKIAVDDFGVGYSSLSYIHTLAPDVIKIDRCFISEVATNPITRGVVRTIIELAHNVGAQSVAEGVETSEQARTLAELGCDQLQGFFFSKPVHAAASLALASGIPGSAIEMPEIVSVTGSDRIGYGPRLVFSPGIPALCGPRARTWFADSVSR